ncbi:MAG TPA: Asd/ArgC dimerization domain-containing protein [Myxococcaceae bacterium]|nr:Asd/ArgC dimerization domain-containing protein [Myxococcaceae bacterium]
MDRSARVAVVGATGLVGREVLAALAEAGHPPGQVTALASERSAGEEVGYGNETLEVEAASSEALRGQALVLLAAPAEVARGLAPEAQKAGAWVVDASRAFLSDVGIPLAAPGFPGDGLERPFTGRLVRVPGPTALGVLRAVEPLRKSAPVTAVRVTALLGAASAGTRGIRELAQSTTQLLSGRVLEPTHFPHRLAFNVVPQVGPFSEASGGTLEELSWRAETTLLFGAGAPPLDGTALLVPVFHGVLVCLGITLARGLSPSEAREALRGAPGVQVLDAPGERVYPMPMLVVENPAILVGRVRAWAGRPDALELVAALDGPRVLAGALVAAGEALMARAVQ